MTHADDDDVYCAPIISYPMAICFDDRLKFSLTDADALGLFETLLLFEFFLMRPSVNSLSAHCSTYSCRPAVMMRDCDDEDDDVASTQ